MCSVPTFCRRTCIKEFRTIVVEEVWDDNGEYFKDVFKREKREEDVFEEYFEKEPLCVTAQAEDVLEESFKKVSLYDTKQEEGEIEGMDVDTRYLGSSAQATSSGHKRSSSENDTYIITPVKKKAVVTKKKVENPIFVEIKQAVIRLVDIVAAGLWKPDDGSKPSTANTRKKASKKSDFNENVRIYRDRWAKRKVNYRNKNEKCSTCSRFGFEKHSKTKLSQKIERTTRRRNAKKSKD